MTRYSLPDFLRGRCSEDQYRKWLHRKAVAHLKRDRRRDNSATSVSAYKAAIHDAVLDGGEYDPYTGTPLVWELISTYDNRASKSGGREYKKRLADLPTVDHVGHGLGTPEFRICSWRTNGAKNDLSYEEFVLLCEAVLAHVAKQKKAGTMGTL
jgi:hypothetical protein